MWQTICEHISDHLGRPVGYQGNRSVSGGCIHNAQALDTDQGRFFVKVNQSETLPMFEAEADALQAIRDTRTIRCPDVIATGVASGKAFLVLEYIAMQSAQSGSMARLGQQLAKMHGHTRDRFGWHRDNNIGLTPQTNPMETSWIEFYRKHRLEFQMRLCRGKGLRLQDGNKLLDNLSSFFQGYDPVPSLLHGDLWGGNASFDERGNPVLFDPATYYGDREADLAFTEMFGGFSSEFYSAYQSALPLHEGYAYRKRLYNLYHELNHYYLFGGGYGSQAQASVRYLVGRI